MRKILPLSIAVNGIISIISLTILFHALVIAGVIPINIVWGGNLTDKTQLYTMEAVSIALNGMMLFIILSYSGAVRPRINRKFIIGAIWFMFLLFLLNTVGNLLAKSSTETYIFTPVTFLLAVFCLRIAAFEYRKK